ncbi:Flp pilus assembly protein TadD, contains TPR repeats [Prochlorococcus marinus str. MIT 9515]|uniref:Flp pilus assembly protein TadD, contains TPR repeats n=1 Tax=Prochlorococcus marinus (strain MIT 9515) TaxID=167542 RepID=A2BTW2_PROM5|nr:tetratricopeptide repeat protein [Prochlorococcus marinus]ABM71214.1 Flp pilus assembly protein TadD, contains TPR repeats [Prochlorococcus marinus str. MIT 9515]
MQKSFIKLLFFSIISCHIFNTQNLRALVPYYHFPDAKHLEQEALSIGKQAYQLLYFGQIKDSLNFAKLAVKINDKNENLWLILAEAQTANELYEDAFNSLNNAQKINPKMSEIYFAKSAIYLKQAKIKKAKISLELGIQIAPENFNAIFQLGNIYLMEKDYEKALKEFDKAIEIKKDFWQAINNKGLAYYELNNINLSIISFKKAISIEENAEPLLALASCLSIKDINEAIFLAKKALIKEPNYVKYNYRKEQLWGEKLQNSTEKLFENNKLKEEIFIARTKIN